MQILNREAGDKAKGFRLQKLRATELIFNELNPGDNVVFYAALEHIEDVSLTNLGGEAQDSYVEEDKNYDPNIAFTIFSEPVKNTLVSFFDIYIANWRSSKFVRLGFYTTTACGKEKKKLVCDDGSEISPPSEPLLKLLAEGGTLTAEALRFLHTALLEEYRSQYSDPARPGNLISLEQLTPDRFQEFLDCISWTFGGANNDELKERVIEKIRRSPLFTIRHEGKEEVIFSLIMELLDERQSHSDLVQRVVFSSDIELVFKKAESESSSEMLDPVWEQLAEAKNALTDKRSLAEKIESVCPDFSPEKTTALARLACSSKIEQRRATKSLLSLKYRVYEKCSEHLASAPLEKLDEEGVEEKIEALRSASIGYIDELKIDYSYPLTNKVALNGLVLDLFDGCFLAFDEAEG